MSTDQDLKDIRSDIGTMFFIPTGTSDEIVYDLAIVHTALHQTEICLRAFENKTSNIHYVSEKSTVILWFLALESYINTILRLIKKKNTHGKSLEKLFKDSLAVRFNFILDDGEYDRESKKRVKDVRKYLNDFSTFRHELIHDLAINNKTYVKAIFSGNAHQINASDVIQAMVIYLQVVTLFQHFFHTIDLMPFIFIQVDSGIGNIRLDRYYTNILKPYINALLKKHNLYTSIDLDIDKYIMPPSKYCYDGENAYEIGFSIKGKPEDGNLFFNHLKDEKTNLWGDIVYEVTKNMTVQQDAFRTPSILRNIYEDNNNKYNIFPKK